jgi:prepilin-type N-terminal cleavage/methylation domain-containing protein
MLKKLFARLSRIGGKRGQKGFTLVEVVISIALIGIVGAAVFMGLGTASNVLLNTDARETAKNLAETRLEIVKRMPYVPGSGTSVYTVDDDDPPALPTGYSASIVVIDGLALSPPKDGNLQKIIVTITGAGITYTLEGYKTK